MIAVLDTSSLLAFVRYYLPFDNSSSLLKCFERKFDDGELILLDKVYDEIKYTAGGLILDSLPFLKDKAKHFKTDGLIPSRGFYNLLENQFCDHDVKKLKDISDTEFEIEKTRFLNSADANILLYSLSIKSQQPIVVTEESRANNDGKLFKKIPENCRCVDINCATLPTFLKESLGLNLAEILG